MNHCVPDWSVQDEDSRHGLPPSANRSKSMWPEDDLVELLWQNGHVVMQSQTQMKAMNSPCEITRRCQKPESAVKGGPLKSAAQEAAPPWPLQYTIDDDGDDDCFDGELYQEFLCELPAMAGSTPAVAAEGNEAAAERGTPERDATFSGSVLEQADVTPFAEAAMPHRSGSVASSKAAAKGSSISGISHLRNFFRPSTEHPSSLGHERAQADAREITIASSSGGSGSTVGRAGQPGANYRNPKRKGRDADESELQSEEAGYESVETSRQSQRSASARRTRAAEVHNLSERRRRDRINEKMKALQELIPHCNKSDKASMLDEAIEYLKSLQLQVQIMWMRSGLAPMTLPGVRHQSMLQMGMGMGHASMPPSIHAPIPFPWMPLLNQPVSSIPTVNHATLCPPSNPPNFPNQMQDPHLPMLYAHCLGFQHLQSPPQMMNLFAYGGANLMQQNQAAFGAGSSAPSPGEDGNAG